MKDQLNFDVTDANTIADSDSVGAFVRSSDGTLITHSTVGGKEALDVSIADGINVEVDLSHVDDSVRLGDGTSFFTSTSENGDIALDVHISNTSLVVTATQLDIDDLNATDDAVQSHLYDGAGTALTSTLVGADQALDVNVVQTTGSDEALANTAILAAADTLATPGTAEKVVAANLADRKYLFVRNNDNRVMYVGGSGVDAATGFPVSPGSVIELRAGASVDVYYDSAKAGHAIRTLELS